MMVFTCELHLWIIRIMVHVLLRLLGPKKMSAAYLAGFQSKSSKRIIFVPCLLFIHLNLILFIWSYNQMKWITCIHTVDCLMHPANSSMSRINSSGGGIWPHVVPTRQLLGMRFRYQKYVGKSIVWLISAWLDFGLCVEYIQY